METELRNQISCLPDLQFRVPLIIALLVEHSYMLFPI